MPPPPELPPAYQLVALDRDTDAFERARARAPGGLDDGTVYWTDRPDRLLLAFALEPEEGRSTADALEAVYALALAAGEALGHPGVAFAWPGGLVLDGAGLGRVRAAAAPTCDPEAAPPWLVVGLDLAVGAGPTGDGPAPAPALTTAELAARVARRFLAWDRRRREEGFAPVRAAWNARCLGLGAPATVRVQGSRRSGRVGGLDADGALLLGDAALPLEAVLADGLG